MEGVGSPETSITLCNSIQYNIWKYGNIQTVETYQISRYRRLSFIDTLYDTPCGAPEVRIAFMPISSYRICASENALQASRQRRRKGLFPPGEADLFYLSPLRSEG